MNVSRAIRLLPAVLCFLCIGCGGGGCDWARNGPFSRCRLFGSGSRTPECVPVSGGAYPISYGTPHTIPGTQCCNNGGTFSGGGVPVSSGGGQVIYDGPVSGAPMLSNPGGPISSGPIVPGVIPPGALQPGGSPLPKIEGGGREQPWDPSKMGNPNGGRPATGTGPKG